MKKHAPIGTTATEETLHLTDEEKLSVLHSVLHLTEEAIICTTPDGMITGWNPAARRIFDYSAEEITGKNISIIIPDSQKHEAQQYVRAGLEEGQSHFIETVRLAKGGTSKNILLSVYPIKNAQNEVSGILRVIRDITFTQEAHEKKAVLASIVDSSEDAIISKNMQGVITSWNRSAQKMFGYTESEAIGRHISLIIPADKMEEENYILSSIAAGKKIDHFNTIRRAKDGSLKEISVSISPIRNHNGEITGASKVARDISLWKEVERQRERYMQKLEKLNQYKDDFMAMASHELKTPLTVVLANLEILRMVSQHEQHIAYVERTHKQVLKLANLVTNLLDVSKMQLGRLELNKEVFDLNKLLTDVISYLQQNTEIHTIMYNKAHGELLVKGDKARIEQVITNIIGNAVKYTPAGGDILVACYNSNEGITIRIEDKGIGIPEKDLVHIFERFFRVSGSAGSFSGSGIGLYICSEIIKAHGGHIWAESAIGKGSVFYFTLPSKE